MRVTALVVVMLLLASGSSRGVAAAEAEEDLPEFLFVQTATGAVLNETLTLTDVSADTTYFADRPDRIAGSMLTEDFLTFFGTEEEDFNDVRRDLNGRCVLPKLSWNVSPERVSVSLTLTLSLRACVCICMCVCVYASRILPMPPWCAGLMASRRQLQSSYRFRRCRLMRTACRHLYTTHPF